MARPKIDWDSKLGLIVEGLNNGLNLDDACAAAHCTGRSARAQMKEDSAFRTAIEQARKNGKKPPLEVLRGGGLPTLEDVAAGCWRIAAANEGAPAAYASLARVTADCLKALAGMPDADEQDDASDRVVGFVTHAAAEEWRKSREDAS